MKRLLLLVALVALVAAATSCTRDRDTPAASPQSSARSVIPQPTGSTPPAVEPAPTSASGSPHPLHPHSLESDDPYAEVGRLLAARGVRVWWESDLVARWLDGSAAFTEAVQRLGQLAQQPGTAGIKVADELGYHDGITSADQATRFLRDTRQALGRVAPDAEILVDVVVMEIGCHPRASGVADCAERARQTAPAASIDAITGYLRAGLIDRLDLSTGLDDADTYPRDDLEAAQEAAWTEVADGPWPRLTTLQSRKALAAPGGYAGNAAADLATYLRVPQAHGARATDLWTWRQQYQGETVSLFGSDATSSPLWAPLEAAHRAGVQLFTHMTPSTLPQDAAGRAHECDLAARVFTDMLVAAGTG